MRCSARRAVPALAVAVVVGCPVTAFAAAPHAPVALSVTTATSRAHARPVHRLGARPTTAGSAASTTSTVFANATAFSTPLGAATPQTEGDRTLVAALAATPLPGSIGTGPYATGLFVATASTPRYRLSVAREGYADGQWGDDVLAHTTVPIPDDVVVPSGTDGKVVVVDPTTGTVYDLWQLRRTATAWGVTWGGAYPLDGDGVAVPVPWTQPASRGTGSGISSLAGMITISDVAAGSVDHALAFASSFTCARGFVAPATMTDGWRDSGTCIPEGTRLRLDPTVDLAAIPGITPAEVLVGRALQRYGAYCVDSGGAPIGVVAQLPATAAQQATYRTAGMLNDYTGLPHLPWASLQVVG